jgi:hypothetical protein
MAYQTHMQVWAQYPRCNFRNQPTCMHVCAYVVCMYKHRLTNKSTFTMHHMHTITCQVPYIQSQSHSRICRMTLQLASRCLHDTRTGTGSAACLVFVYCYLVFVYCYYIHACSLASQQRLCVSNLCGCGCMYIYPYVCICTLLVYIYIYIYVHTHIHIHVCARVCTV